MFKPDKKIFRNATGQWYTNRLFLERSYTVNDKSNTIYTLRNEDHPEGYVSLYRLYMEEADPTEYAFADKYLDGYQHWQLLCSSTWFKPYIEQWREELETRIKSSALKTIERISKDNSHKNQFEAIKILLSLGWKEKTSGKGKGRGRPSDDEVKGQLKQLAEEEKSLAEEYKRVMAEE